MSNSASNPKAAVAAAKIDLALVPPSGIIHAAHALTDGAKKYRPYNWREGGVYASVYIAAALRHLAAYQDGENIAPDSGVHHLAHVIGGLMILLDAAECETLVDDRPLKGHAHNMIARLQKRTPDARFTAPEGEVYGSGNGGGTPRTGAERRGRGCSREAGEAYYIPGIKKQVFGRFRKLRRRHS